MESSFRQITQNQNILAGFGSDKVYALLGLLKSENPTKLVPEYNKPPDEIFLFSPLACVKDTNNLPIVTLAGGVEFQVTS